MFWILIGCVLLNGMCHPIPVPKPERGYYSEWQCKRAGKRMVDEGRFSSFQCWPKLAKDEQQAA